MNIGGEKKWLEQGLDAVPQKLKNLQELNSLLAYKPWSLYQSNCLKVKNGKNRKKLIILEGST